MKKISLLICFILFGLTIINASSSYSQCQCPSDIPPLHIPWNAIGPAYVTVMDDNGHYCEFEVYYCWRQYQDIAPNPWFEIIVCNFSPTENCNENFSLPIWKIYKKLGEKIIETNPDNLGWPTPPCPEVYPYYSVKTLGCYDNEQSCGGSVFCQYIYEVMKCQGQTIVTQVNWGIIGGDCPIGCISQCGE